ncbi:MAG: hypothetical protein C5S48_10380 [Candidatus Methanogaster sp.]|nr:MAG: hypothetical protein C5S48_10380 [ANME-2 cluster archaeon]
MAKYKTSTLIILVLAGLMMLMMVLAPLTPLFWGDNEPDNAAQPAQNSDSDNRIPLNNFGKLVDHPLYSVADGLNASPPGVLMAQYIHAKDLEGTPLAEQIVPQGFYGTNVTDSYAAIFGDGSQMGLHTLYPRKLVLGSSIVVPTKYDGYQVLIRNKDVCNILGDPCILGPRSKVEATVDVIDNETAPNAYPYFIKLLENVDLDAPYQEVSMYSPIADQYYSTVYPVGDMCKRTITCIGIRENTTARVNELAANMTDNLECAVAFNQGDLNLTIITITGDCDAVMAAKID